MVTQGVPFTGFFVASLLRMTGGRKRAVGDAGPYNAPPHQSLPLEGEVAFAKQMTVGGKSEAGTAELPPFSHAARDSSP